MKWKKNETQNSEARIEKLADEVRSAAYKSMEALWSAFLEVGELDMVRATEKALRLLVGHGDYTGAMVFGVPFLRSGPPTQFGSVCLNLMQKLFFVRDRKKSGVYYNNLSNADLYIYPKNQEY